MLMVTNANFVECTLGSCSGIMGVGFSKHHFNGYLAVHCQGIVINSIAKFLKKIIIFQYASTPMKGVIKISLKKYSVSTKTYFLNVNKKGL